MEASANGPTSPQCTEALLIQLSPGRLLATLELHPSKCRTSESELSARSAYFTAPTDAWSTGDQSTRAGSKIQPGRCRPGLHELLHEKEASKEGSLKRGSSKNSWLKKGTMPGLS